jgi:hypothetical protein
MITINLRTLAEATHTKLFQHFRDANTYIVAVSVTHTRHLSFPWRLYVLAISVMHTITLAISVTFIVRSCNFRDTRQFLPFPWHKHIRCYNFRDLNTTFLKFPWHTSVVTISVKQTHTMLPFPWHTYFVAISMKHIPLSCDFRDIHVGFCHFRDT